MGVAHAEIQSDHVLRRGHPRVKLRRARMIAASRPYPTNAALAGFLDSQFRGSFHNQVPQGVVAVDECDPSSVVQYPNAGPRIDSPALDLLHVLRQPEHAVRVPATRVGFGHQSGHLSGILQGNPGGRQRTRDEPDDFSYPNAWVARRGLGGFAHDLTLYSAIITASFGRMLLHRLR